MCHQAHALTLDGMLLAYSFYQDKIFTVADKVKRMQKTLITKCELIATEFDICW